MGLLADVRSCPNAQGDEQLWVSHSCLASCASRCTPLSTLNPGSSQALVSRYQAPAWWGAEASGSCPSCCCGLQTWLWILPWRACQRLAGSALQTALGDTAGLPCPLLPAQPRHRCLRHDPHQLAAAVPQTQGAACAVLGKCSPRAESTCAQLVQPVDCTTLLEPVSCLRDLVGQGGGGSTDPKTTRLTSASLHPCTCQQRLLHPCVVPECVPAW